MTSTPASMILDHLVVVPPASLRPDLDLYGLPLVRGCRVRAFNQARASEDGRLFGFEIEGERADYIEGTLKSIGEVFNAAHRCYEIAADHQVDGGLPREHRQSYHPPVNGTPTSLGRITVGVMRVVRPAARARSIASAVAQMQERIREQVYALLPEPSAADQERTALRLKGDLEACFGFADEPGIPDRVRTKAFEIARRNAFNRVGRFVPGAIVEDYADLAEIMRIAQRAPIPFETR